MVFQGTVPRVDNSWPPRTTTWFYCFTAKRLSASCSSANLKIMFQRENEKNCRARTMFQRENHGARTMFQRENHGARTMFQRENDGARTMFQCEYVPARLMFQRDTCSSSKHVPARHVPAQKKERERESSFNINF